MMVDIIGGFNAIFRYFGQNIHLILLLGGFFAGFYFVYWFFRGSPEEGGETPILLKVMTYLGVLIGIFLLGAGVNAWQQGIYTTFTCILAIVVGIALILRPIKDVPWAAIIGVIVGSIVVFFTATYLNFFTDGFANLLGIDPYWVLIILFVFILLLCYMAFKLIEDIGKLLGKLLSCRPTSAAILIICTLEALLYYIDKMSLWTVISSLF